MVKLDIVDTGNIVGKSVKKQNCRKVIPDESFAIDVEENETCDCYNDNCKCGCFVSSCVIMLIVVIVLLVILV